MVNFSIITTLNSRHFAESKHEIHKVTRVITIARSANSSMDSDCFMMGFYNLTHDFLRSIKQQKGGISNVH